MGEAINFLQKVIKNPVLKSRINICITRLGLFFFLTRFLCVLVISVAMFSS